MNKSERGYKGVKEYIRGRNGQGDREGGWGEKKAGERVRRRVRERDEKGCIEGGWP